MNFVIGVEKMYFYSASSVNRHVSRPVSTLRFLHLLGDIYIISIIHPLSIHLLLIPFLCFDLCPNPISYFLIYSVYLWRFPILSPFFYSFSRSLSFPPSDSLYQYYFSSVSFSFSPPSLVFLLTSLFTHTLTYL